MLEVDVVEEQGAVSEASPSQAEEEGALQFRILNLMPQGLSGSHSDHSPQSDQKPEPVC